MADDTRSMVELNKRLEELNRKVEGLESSLSARLSESMSEIKLMMSKFLPWGYDQGKQPKSESMNLGPKIVEARRHESVNNWNQRVGETQIYPSRKHVAAQLTRETYAYASPTPMMSIKPEIESKLEAVEINLQVQGISSSGAKGTTSTDAIQDEEPSHESEAKPDHLTAFPSSEVVISDLEQMRNDGLQPYNGLSWVKFHTSCDIDSSFVPRLSLKDGSNEKQFNGLCMAAETFITGKRFSEFSLCNRVWKPGEISAELKTYLQKLHKMSFILNMKWYLQDLSQCHQRMKLYLSSNVDCEKLLGSLDFHFCEKGIQKKIMTEVVLQTICIKGELQLSYVKESGLFNLQWNLIESGSEAHKPQEIVVSALTQNCVRKLQQIGLYRWHRWKNKIDGFWAVLELMMFRLVSFQIELYLLGIKIKDAHMLLLLRDLWERPPKLEREKRRSKVVLTTKVKQILDNYQSDYLRVFSKRVDVIYDIMSEGAFMEAKGSNHAMEYFENPLALIITYETFHSPRPPEPFIDSLSHSTSTNAQHFIFEGKDLFIVIRVVYLLGIPCFIMKAEEIARGVRMIKLFMEQFEKHLVTVITYYMFHSPRPPELSLCKEEENFEVVGS